MTDQLAVVSDIHGNVRALDAVVVEIERRRIETIVNLGDCFYGPFDPRPVADRLLSEGWATVAGNEDRCLTLPLGPATSRTARFTRERLTLAHLDWLSKLPDVRRIGERIVAFHGRPDDNAAYLLSRSDGRGGVRRATNEEVRAALRGIRSPLILCGHDHLPRVVRLEDDRTIVNPGSVGCPAYTEDHPVPHAVENRTPHARFAIVTIDGESVRAESIRVDYDWNRAATEAKANGFPDWATWIATGRVFPLEQTS